MDLPSTEPFTQKVRGSLESLYGTMFIQEKGTRVLGLTEYLKMQRQDFFFFLFPKELDSSKPVLSRLSIVSFLWESRIQIPEAIVEALIRLGNQC